LVGNCKKKKKKKRSRAQKTKKSSTFHRKERRWLIYNFPAIIEVNEALEVNAKTIHTWASTFVDDLQTLCLYKGSAGTNCITTLSDA